MENPDACSNSNWYRLEPDTYSKEAFSVLLSALMSGKKIQFALLGCYGGYPQVDWINVYD